MRHIVLFTPSTDMYGSDRALLTALPALVEHNQVTAFVPCQGPLIAHLEDAGVEVVLTPDFAVRRRDLSPVGLVRWFGRVAKTMWMVRRSVRGRGVDLFYINTSAVMFFPLLRLIRQAPVLLHVHERARGASIEQKVINFTARFADLIVANSHFTASTLGSSATRVRVVYNGVAFPDLPVPAMPEGSPFTVVCVGRIHPKKGQQLLLDAAEMACRDGKHWRIVIRGGVLPEHQHLLDRLEARASSAPLAGTVTFHPYSASTDDLYLGAHVSVVPSVDPEEFSLVAAEAQARALATVVTGPGGAAEVVDDGVTGFVVGPNGAELYDRLSVLDEDPALRVAMGRAGRERVSTHFLPEHMIGGIRQAIDDLAPSQPVDPPTRRARLRPS